MFAPAPETARVFGLPCGVDFPRALATGLAARLAPLAPEARARVTLLVNSARMRRQVRTALVAQGPGLLPRIRLISDPLLFPQAAALPPPVAPLRRRLELAQLVERLLTAAPDLAPRSALYDLSDSLARLFAEMQAEGVSPERLATLDVSRHSAHWARSLAFITLADQVLRPDALDAEGRVRAQAEALIATWSGDPPADPVLIAGSTGSRGTTALLMQAVARLPQGAVVLPGFDTDLPPDLWPRLEAEDHPQFRYQSLMGALGITPDGVQPWCDTPPPSPERNRLVSLALRPAPVTDQWMTEGRLLQGIDTACAGISLIEAPSPRMEALAIALRLRRAAEEGQSAALITPDRDLSRRVTAALDRWRITPDDSAGRPLALSAPGRFLRHVAGLMVQRLDTVALMVLLKHPLTHSGAGRAAHLLHTRDLELRLRRGGVAYPAPAFLRDFGAKKDCVDWAEWLIASLGDPLEGAALPFAELVAAHLARAEGLAGGSEREAEGGTGELWLAAAGDKARAAMGHLARESPHGGALTPRDYESFVTSYLQGFEVREPVAAHPGIMIWGTLEARVQGAGLVILAGLNDGVWPKAPDPDPWLNRRMRADAGLLAPERQIGLSAHDFQQAIAAPEVVLSRAVRDAEAQTVPSRWLNRLTNLLDGLPDQGGRVALDGMRARGAQMLALAAAFEADPRGLPDDPPAPRPAPAPPLTARPRELPVTAISRLIRNPYEVYARYVLRLRKLDALHPSPDALLRGTVLHKVLEEFTASPPEPDALAQLLRLSAHVLARDVPWPAARALWQARMARAAQAFLAFHLAQPGRALLLEEKGAFDLRDPVFRLTAKPDRIDEWPDGEVHIIDYKTGTPPTEKQQKHFDKQLLLEAMMAEEGAFEALGLRDVARITYLGLGNPPKLEATAITPAILSEARAEFERLIRAYLDEGRGFAARRMLLSVRDTSDYDHLSRYGEWTQQDTPVTLPVGRDVDE